MFQKTSSGRTSSPKRMYVSIAASALTGTATPFGCPVVPDV